MERYCSSRIRQGYFRDFKNVVICRGDKRRLQCARLASSTCRNDESKSGKRIDCKFHNKSCYNLINCANVAKITEPATIKWRLFVKTTIMDDRISYREKKELPDSVFGLPERREYPMPDAAHVRAAEAYFRYCPEELRPQLARAIVERAREFGVDVESPTVLSYARQ